MEIIASSVQKAGDYFLHAGYLSAATASHLTFDPPGVLVTTLLGACIVGRMYLGKSTFAKRWMKVTADLVLFLLILFGLLVSLEMMYSYTNGPP